MNKKYDIPDYNKYLSLKVDLKMWVILLYLIHPYWILVLSIVNRKDRTALLNIVYPDRLPMSLAAAAAIPTLLVLYALKHRKPNANSKVRWLWRNGRLLLLLSTILYASVPFISITLASTYKASNSVWIQLGICVLITLYLLLSRRVRDTFSDFPVMQEDEK